MIKTILCSSNTLYVASLIGTICPLASATVILNDTFSDNGRTDGVDLQDTTWFLRSTTNTALHEAARHSSITGPEADRPRDPDHDKVRTRPVPPLESFRSAEAVEGLKRVATSA